MAHIGVSEGLVELVGAASHLSDLELAVALQGILTRRPAVREALLSVMRAESIIDQRSTSSATGAEPSQSSRSSSYAADPVLRLRIASQRVAAFHGAASVGCEHVLGAAAHMLQAASRIFHGHCLHNCIVELLERSSLQPPVPGQSQASYAGLAFQAEAERVFTEMMNCPNDASIAVFAALSELPGNAAASKLLGLARDMAQSRDTTTGSNFAQSEDRTREIGDGEIASVEPRGSGSSADASEGVIIMAQRFAEHNQSKKVCTEHILAAALQAFPEESEKLLGTALSNQLSELLEKSSLEPPAPADRGHGITLEPEATKFFDDWSQRGATPDNMIQMLLSMPDEDAATQLIEMAKVFVQNSS